MPVTSASTHSTFRCLRISSRSGEVIFPSDKIPVAHWNSSGWNRWCAARSISVTLTGARRNCLAANSPAKPPPMITTRRGLAWSSIAPVLSLCLVGISPQSRPRCIPRRGYPGLRRFLVGGRLELLGADPPPEDVVGPGLIGEHDRQKDDGDDGHHLERVRGGGRVVHGEVVGGAGGGDHHVGVQAGEDRHDGRGHGDGGGGEGKTVPVRLVDQPCGGQD